MRALPFQCVSLEWPVLVSARGALVEALSPDEARRGVHAVQDSAFHRPIVPGDRLITEGRLASVRRSRAGVVAVFKLVTRERDGGAPVVTTWSTSIYRGVELTGDDVALELQPDPPPADTGPPGEGAERRVLRIPREMPHVYTECADIWNPIHTERREALAAGLPDIILHGTATWALAGLEILERHADCDIGRLARLTSRFTGMIIPGEEIVIRHAPADDGTVRFEVLNAAGAPAISQGVAWIRPSA